MSDGSSPSGSEKSWLRSIFNGSSSAADEKAKSSQSYVIKPDALEELRVADVMVPRADIIGVEIATQLGELAGAFSAASHSRLPVYRETLDDPIGVVHIKDVVSHLTPSEDGRRPEGWAEQEVLSDIHRPLLYAPPSMKAGDLLRRMQARRMHMALVVDEYGGTDGLVTLEDLIEPIVGEIEDEHDEDDSPLIRVRAPGVWDVDARAEIDEFERVVGEEIAADDEDDDVDSLGGLVFTIAGRIPERGEVIRHATGYEFEVLEADQRRIRRMRVRTARAGKSGMAE
ncbi:transporter associated domain-containing protein [Maricaulis sp.]|uniref:transporter associated domain-containing protein n=1 Tax=unclassified Maricaulis TaxID=2632371 RepID=UPI001B09162F|nr:transporter associated domain-containing protein [Maricaulis sp.]MBO6795690.1 CBS domain-containing protein [Maricaulis sp.]